MSLYRGAGGASDATDDSTVNAVAGYASAAASSATSAATSATNASNSATAAASSASSAASSASSVSTDATNASTSAALALNSASLALTYRTSAFTNRNLAQAAAGAASASASNAASSAATASTQATSASDSASAATISANNAGVSAAQALAIYGNTAAMNSAVTAAATSASNAASSAFLAQGYSLSAAGNLGTSLAAVSSASAYADASQNSANDAQAYATAALSARDLTLAAYDSFDDRYLGVKSSNPSVDNDGNPLIAGSLYFNDQTNMMMLYAGGFWVAAYTSGGSPSFGNTVVNGTLQVTGATTLSGGTANGVAYLNGSKVLTTGSALTFDGTNLTLGANTFTIKNATGDTSGLKLYQAASDVSTIMNHYNGSIAFGTGNTERMRLTSTGLGIGTSSPSAKLHIQGSQFRQNDATNSYGYVINTTSGTTTLATLFGGSTFAIQTGASGSNQLLLDASGNLGIGVTPSAWEPTAYKAVDINSNAGGIYGGASRFGLTNNAYLNASGVWTYKTTGYATRYQSYSGEHQWYTAPSSSGAITFTQAMTLDASGNLLVGTTSATSGGGVLQVSNGITFPATQSPSSNVNTLDDYEEGTWNPTISTTGTAPTVTSYEGRTGIYTKIGNLVTAQCYIRATLSAAGTGTATLTGLPFTASSSVLPSPALGIKNLLTGTINPYVSSSTVFFDGGSWVTGVSNYICFTVSYQV